MTPLRRSTLALSILALGLGAAKALDAATHTERPELRRTLATLPMELGGWVGRDEPVESGILKESQADDYLNRIYEDSKHPGRKLVLWINYSRHGLNLRHSPEVCLPGGGFSKVESQTRVLDLGREGVDPLPMSRLVYAKGELVQTIGFWYYIFGEGSVEHFVRGLPITSRSSHGRATRGSGLTVEVFCPGEVDPEGLALHDFARSLLPALEPILPETRAQYYIP